MDHAVIPAGYQSNGTLSPGIHDATWKEVCDRFGSTEQRRQLLDQVRAVLLHLASVGVRDVWLDGSFVTDKLVPSDYDLCYELTQADLKQIDPVLLDFSTTGRRKMKAKYGGDVMPHHPQVAFLRFFQRDRDGSAKGIIRIDMGTVG